MIEVKTARNVLICVGAYYISKWLALPLAFVWGKLTTGAIYRGDFAGVILLPLVEHVPIALVAGAVGVVVVWLVETNRPLRWLFFPALLYAFFGLLGYHWSRPPLFLDRVSQAIGALFPALTCLISGVVALRQRTSKRTPTG